MANLKSDGKIFDANLIISTGATITAGSLIFVDVSGTNVVRAVRSYSGASPESSTPNTGGGYASLDTALSPSGLFLGVICSTQTGTPNLSGGHQTGVAWYTEGCFEFNTTPTAAAVISGGSTPLRIGYPVWALNHDTVKCYLSGLATADATASNTTGTSPIGVVRYLPRGPIGTATTASRVGVEIKPFNTIQRAS